MLIFDRALAGFTVSTSGHSMTVIDVDGGSTVDAAPAAKALGIIYPGERVSVIVQRVDSSDAILTVAFDREYALLPF